MNDPPTPPNIGRAAELARELSRELAALSAQRPELAPLADLARDAAALDTRLRQAEERGIFIPPRPD